MSSPGHSYYDWQLSTLLLAYDAAEPILREDKAQLTERQKRVEKELYDLVHATLPRDYLESPQKDFPVEVVVQLTRATLRRAAQIIGV